MIEDGFDTAQVCPNGHVANSMAANYPESNEKFCEKCGEQTLMECSHCSEVIRGHYHISGVVGFSEYHPPAYCHNCGKPFPWTELAMNAAIEMAVESGNLNENEQEEFRVSVHEVTRDTPRAQLAGSRIVRLLGKMSKVTGQAIREILVDIVSETVKKVMWPDE